MKIFPIDLFFLGFFFFPFFYFLMSGITVDGRDIMVQFAKYGPNAERM